MRLPASAHRPVVGGQEGNMRYGEMAVGVVEDVIREFERENATDPLFIRWLMECGFSRYHIAQVIMTLHGVCNHCWDAETPCRCTDDLTRERDALKEENVRLRMALAETEAVEMTEAEQVKALKAELKRLKREIITLLDSIHGESIHSPEHAGIAVSCAEAEIVVSDLRDANASLRTRLESAEKERNALLARVTPLEKDNANLERQVCALRLCVDDAENAIHSLALSLNARVVRISNGVECASVPTIAEA